jgi:hypothetical protein
MCTWGASAGKYGWAEHSATITTATADVIIATIANQHNHHITSS